MRLLRDAVRDQPRRIRRTLLRLWVELRCLRHSHALAHHRRQRFMRQRGDRAGEARRLDARHLAAKRSMCQLEMSEAVAHLAGRPPCSLHGREGQAPRRCPTASAAIPCRAVRSCRRAARRAGVGATARCRPRRSARSARHAAAAAPASLPCVATWQRCRRAGRHNPTSKGTARRPASPVCTPWRQDRTAPERSRTASPALPDRSPSRAARSRNSGFALGSCSSTANSRATTRSTLPSTGTAGTPNAIAADRRRGVIADPRQRTQPGRIAWEPTRRNHRAGAGVQVAGAGVVAEPRPGGEHVLQRGGGQRPDGRETDQESFIVRDRRRNGGLLQHDLAEPDVVWIGGLARGGAPGQRPAVSVIPGEQRRGWEGHRERYEQRRTSRLWPAPGQCADAAPDPRRVPASRAGNRPGTGRLVRDCGSCDRRGDHAAAAGLGHSHHRLRRAHRDGAAAHGRRGDRPDQHPSRQPGGDHAPLRADS